MAFFTIERPFGLCRRSVKLAGASAFLNFEIRMLAPSRHGDKTRRPSGIILGFGISILCLVIFCHWAVIVLEKVRMPSCGSWRSLI